MDTITALLPLIVGTAIVGTFVGLCLYLVLDSIFRGKRELAKVHAGNAAAAKLLKRVSVAQ